MAHKNYLEVERENEKEFYRICKDLEKNGKSIIEGVNDKEWWKPLSIKLGCESKNLIEKRYVPNDKRHIDQRLLCPPVTNRKHDFAIVSVYNNVKVKEKPLKKKSRFFLKIL